MNSAASSDANPSGVKGVCPDGWHMPGDSEWKQLEVFLGMSQVDADKEGKDRGTNEGDELKSTSGWNSSGNGANKSGFTALPSGSRRPNGSFTDLGDRAYFWSSTEGGSTFTWGRSLGSDHSKVYHYYYDKKDGFSVSCVKD
jgi:uncharacterized protein (TIGR02145 family)